MRFLKSPSLWALVLGIPVMVLLQSTYSLGDPGVIQVAFSEKRPLIDGIMDAEEWDDAANFQFSRSWNGENHDFDLFLKNDDRYLYIAVLVDGEEIHSSDSLDIEFDNNNNSSEDNYEDRIKVDPYISSFTVDGYLLGGVIKKDTVDGGTSDLTSRVTHTLAGGADPGEVGQYTFEVRHPLDSGDSSS